MEKIRFIVDHVRWLFASQYFDARHKTKVHFVQIILVVLLIGLVGVRIATIPEGVQVSRGDTLGIVMVRVQFAERTIPADLAVGY